MLTRQYFAPASQGASVVEYVFHFQSAAPASQAATFVEESVPACGLPLYDARQNILVHQNAAPLIQSPAQFCQRTVTFGPASTSDPVYAGPGYTTGALCGDNVIALQLLQPAGSDLGAPELSNYLREAVFRLTSAVTSDPTLGYAKWAAEGSPHGLLTADDLGPGWHKDATLHDPQPTPYDCGGPGVPPSLVIASQTDFETGFRNHNDTITQSIATFSTATQASHLVSISKSNYALCTWPAGALAAQHWTIDRSIPTTCDQSFVAYPAQSANADGSYIAEVRCGRSESDVVVTVGPGGAAQLPPASKLIVAVANAMTGRGR